MRMVIELDNKYVSIEIGDLEPEDEADESVTAEESETIRLPLGFQAPPVVEEIQGAEEEEHETEIDCC